jgi:phosphatidylserine decarboxylase
MKNYPHPIIAKEGWPFLPSPSSSRSASRGAAGGGRCPSGSSFLHPAVLPRPPREIPQGEGLVLCPADGKVIVVGKAMDPYRNVEALKISIFMNVFNVHSQRSPVDAVVHRVDYQAGLFVNAAFDKASTDNERNAMVMELADGTQISCVQVAGLIARRILCYVKAGERSCAGSATASSASAPAWMCTFRGRRARRWRSATR